MMKKKKRTFEFLSNNFHLAASTIAAIYKDRWKVELFFKAIKQNLKLKSFLGRSRNAIQTQIWIALIAYLLVSFETYGTRTMEYSKIIKNYSGEFI